MVHWQHGVLHSGNTRELLGVSTYWHLKEEKRKMTKRWWWNAFTLSELKSLLLPTMCTLRCRHAHAHKLTHTTSIHPKAKQGLQLYPKQSLIPGSPVIHKSKGSHPPRLVTKPNAPWSPVTESNQEPPHTREDANRLPQGAGREAKRGHFCPEQTFTQSSHKSSG